MPTIANAKPPSRVVAIALHDVSPVTWPMCQHLLSLVASVGKDIPVTLLIVPNMHRRAPVDEAHEWRALIDKWIARGCEVALHGLWHLDDGGRSPSLRAAIARRVLTAGEAEFAAMDTATARERIEQGLQLLRNCGWQPAGFVPPAWQISDAAASVLSEFPFEYTTTFSSITHLPKMQRYKVPCLGLSARSTFRRALTTRWVSMRSSQLASAPALRIALHPQDASHPDTLKTWTDVLPTVLHDRLPVTKSALCRVLMSSSETRVSQR
jgi:uncharacterized protein